MVAYEGLNKDTQEHFSHHLSDEKNSFAFMSVTSQPKLTYIKPAIVQGKKLKMLSNNLSYVMLSNNLSYVMLSNNFLISHM
jgi:hypothetical protein